MLDSATLTSAVAPQGDPVDETCAAGLVEVAKVLRQYGATAK